MKNLKKEPLTKKVGDKIDRFGEKISSTGAQKVGNAISRVGEKLEHSQDNKRQDYNKKTKR